MSGTELRGNDSIFPPEDEPAIPGSASSDPNVPSSSPRLTTPSISQRPTTPSSILVLDSPALRPDDQPDSIFFCEPGASSTPSLASLSPQTPLYQQINSPSSVLAEKP